MKIKTQNLIKEVGAEVENFFTTLKTYAIAELEKFTAEYELD
jgi:hypothetical protein